ncbi:MAG TPA: hypothetical protein VFN67_36855 [Polyangiales bacterium]|jgi:hypothetical protein|nr:hypothetical protein [Polyangiales bacterium]
MASTKTKKNIKLSDAGAETDVVQRAETDLKRGKSASTAAGEFVREEIEHVREGKHGARSAKQAIAIGLSKARRAGVPLGTPARGRTTERTRKQAIREEEQGPKRKKPAKKRARAAKNALKRESTSTVSHGALSRQAKSAAKRRRAAGGRTVTGRKVATGTQAQRAAAKRRSRKKTARRRS